MIKYEWMGVEALTNALRAKSEIDFKRVERKNLLEMRNRAVSSSDPSKGGTPVGDYSGAGALRLSATVGDDVFGYTEHYGPHVEFGHRLVRGGRTVGYVPGQYYLRTNVNIQQPIYRSDLIEKMWE